MNNKSRVWAWPFFAEAKILRELDVHTGSHWKAKNETHRGEFKQELVGMDWLVFNSLSLLIPGVKSDEGDMTNFISLPGSSSSPSETRPLVPHHDSGRLLIALREPSLFLEAT